MQNSLPKVSFDGHTILPFIKWLQKDGFIGATDTLILFIEKTISPYNFIDIDAFLSFFSPAGRRHGLFYASGTRRAYRFDWFLYYFYSFSPGRIAEAEF